MSIAEGLEASSSSPARVDCEEGHRRIYDGTPQKVPKRKLLELSVMEKQPIFRAKMVTNEDAALVAADEVLITHRKIHNDQEKRIVLSEAFSSETVVVVEAILLLQEQFDAEYTSLVGVREFSPHVSLLLAGVAVEEKPSFSRFCYGLWLSIKRDAVGSPIPVEKGKAKSKRVLASTNEKVSKLETAITAGVRLYIAVGAAVIANNNDNADLVQICGFHIGNLRAWVELYLKKQDRHIESHPFKFICGNVEKACKGLAVLEYVKDSKEYEVLAPLIKAAIPQVKKAIKEREAGNILLRDQMGTDETSIRFHFMTKYGGVLQEFDIMEI